MRIVLVLRTNVLGKTSKTFVLWFAGGGLPHHPIGVATLGGENEIKCFSEVLPEIQHLEVVRMRLEYLLLIFLLWESLRFFQRFGFLFGRSNSESRRCEDLSWLICKMNNNYSFKHIIVSKT